MKGSGSVPDLVLMLSVALAWLSHSPAPTRPGFLKKEGEGLGLGRVALGELLAESLPLGELGDWDWSGS
jgi:hypothetical protein